MNRETLKILVLFAIVGLLLGLAGAVSAQDPFEDATATPEGSVVIEPTSTNVEVESTEQASEEATAEATAEATETPPETVPDVVINLPEQPPAPPSPQNEFWTIQNVFSAIMFIALLIVMANARFGSFGGNVKATTSSLRDDPEFTSQLRAMVVGLSQSVPQAVFDKFVAGLSLANQGVSAAEDVTTMGINAVRQDGNLTINYDYDVPDWVDIEDLQRHIQDAVASYIVGGAPASS